jgi:Ni,Fe-hydrogenase III small subunit
MNDEALAAGTVLEERIRRRLGRSLAIREVDAGSCNGCEVEVNSICNAVHDLERFGLRIVASPRHADMLLVTGPVTRNMEKPLLSAYGSAPGRPMVVAMGACAISGGIFRHSYACGNGVSSFLPVDVFIPGCPPRPEAIIFGILVALDKMPAAPAARP